MYRNVEQWIEIRRRVLNGEISKRQACREMTSTGRRCRKFFQNQFPRSSEKAGRHAVRSWILFVRSSRQFWTPTGRPIGSSGTLAGGF